MARVFQWQWVWQCAKLYNMVNLLGQQNKKGGGKTYTPSRKKETEIYYHLPEKTVAESTETVPLPVPPVVSAPKPKSRLTLFIIIGIIIIAVGLFSLYYIYFFKQVMPVVNVNIPENTNIIVNENENLNIPVVTNVNENENVNVNENENLNTGPTVLPDTELAPLRGSLVKFFGEETVYLVENNGELRIVDTQSVVFENKQKFIEISRSLIYTINDRWKTIRQGRTVRGQVDFDPRILTFAELAPFIR